MSPTEPVREPAEPTATASALSAHVEPLPYPRRMRELALHARRTAGTPELRVLLAELSAQGRDERRTALHMAMAARDLAHVERVLAGPDLELRRAALRAVRTLPVSDEATAAVLHDAPSDLRAACYRMLRHARRAALADRLLPEVRFRWGDREAAALLPACSAETASRLLPDLAHAVTAWRALGSRHPRAFLDQAAYETAHVTHARSWWSGRSRGFVPAAIREPERALSLLEEGSLSQCAPEFPAALVTALRRTDAARTARVLTRSSRRWYGTPETFYTHARSWPEPEIRAALPTDPHTLRRLLRALPPGSRAGLFDLAAERGGGSFGGLRALPVLDLLPPERAAAEARRMLDWHASVWHSARGRLDDPDIPLRLTAYLPYEDGEASGRLAEAAYGGDPRRRGLARTLLLRQAARTRDPALLCSLATGLVARTRNERDPLRGALLTTLAELPPGLLDDALVAPLDELATAAVEARDSSADTRRALRRLAARVLAHGPSDGLTRWALGVYARLVARHGAEGIAPTPGDAGAYGGRRGRRRRPPVPAPHDHRLDRIMGRGLERDLLALLEPHLRAARERRDFGLAVALARSLGRRAFPLGELQDDLRAAVQRSPEPLAREAAALWLARPAGREERAASLAAADPSTITLPEVWRVLSRRRTDLLIPALDGDREGNLNAREWVPYVAPGTAGRWTPAQRGRVRGLLTAAAGDDGLPAAARIAALGSLGRLPGGPGDLVPWAARDETVLAEAALDAMAASDRPAEALQVLLAHAHGPASRVAVAALARCCAAVPPSRLGPVLAETLTGPDGKVTARKQAARLLERHRPPGAAEVLLRTWDDPGLHRDVRVAVAVALRRMPEVPEAVEVLFTAAGPHAGELMARTLFQAGPDEYAPRHRARYAELVRRLLVAAPEPGVRFRGSKAFASWARWYEAGFDGILAAVADPEDDAGRAELPVLLALLRAGVVRDPVLDVLARLLDADPGSAARTRVDDIATALGGMLRQNGTGTWGRDLARRATRLLAARPLYVAQAARIAVRAFDVGDGDGAPLTAERVTEGLAELAGLLHDRPVLAARIADGELRHAFRGMGSAPRVAPPRFLPAARRLAAEGDLAAQLLAVELVRIGGTCTEWTGAWRDVLDGLRASGHVEIRQGAWDISVPD